MLSRTIWKFRKVRINERSLRRLTNHHGFNASALKGSASFNHISVDTLSSQVLFDYPNEVLVWLNPRMLMLEQVYSSHNLRFWNMAFARTVLLWTSENTTTFFTDQLSHHPKISCRVHLKNPSR